MGRHSSVLTAAAFFTVDGIVAIEDRHGIAVTGLERPQPLLILDAHGAIHVGATLNSLSSSGIFGGACIRPKGGRAKMHGKTGR